MRTVLHVQVRDFCASVECVCDPTLQSVPIAVCGIAEEGKGIIISRNNIAGTIGVMTGQTISQARLKCQDLTVLPPDFSKYLNFASRLRRICADYTDLIEAFDMDKLYLDVSACRFRAMDLALTLHRRAREELGLTLSVGISFNKAFARLASDMSTPAATMLITHENFPQKLWPRQAGELMYVNEGVLCELNKLGILTIGDLACADVKLLKEALGIQGKLLNAFALWKDVSQVQCEGMTTWDYSIGNSIVTPLALRCDSDVECLIQLLAASTAKSLQKLCLRSDRISMDVGDCERSVHCSQKKLTRPTASAEDITSAARSLFRENWCWCKPVHSLNLSVSPSIIAEDSLQPKPVQKAELRRFELESTVGELRRRFGHPITPRLLAAQ